jgi:hypothetical protein
VNELLDQHKALMEKKVERLMRIIDNIDDTRRRNERGETMSNKERFDGFDMKDIEKNRAKYSEEVNERWGGSDAYEESMKRASGYKEEDWRQIMERTNDIYRELVNMMDRDITDTKVQELVGNLRQYITEDFYECTMEIFEGLGQMYVTDTRFSKNLDKYGKGFAKYLSDAIDYYCN